MINQNRVRVLYVAILIVLLGSILYLIRVNYVNNTTLSIYKVRLENLETENYNLRENIETIEFNEGKNENMSETSRQIESEKYESNRVSNYTLMGEYKSESIDNLDNMVIELYSNVSLSDDGEYSWDDGQSWLVVVRSEDEMYVLIEKYVQLGVIELHLSKEFDSDADTKIVVVEKTMSGMIIRDYVYSSEKNTFTEQILFEKGNDQNTQLMNICNY